MRRVTCPWRSCGIELAKREPENFPTIRGTIRAFLRPFGYPGDLAHAGLIFMRLRVTLPSTRHVKMEAGLRVRAQRTVSV
jgi:hypothetical protein